jgi:hypothetical protein
VFSAGEVMDDGRSRESPHSGGEITNGGPLTGEAHSGREVAGGPGAARPAHSGREISGEIPVADGASLAAREVGLRRHTGLADVCVEIAADVRRAGVNGCGLQQESSFGFSVSKRLRYGSGGPVAYVQELETGKVMR